MTLLLLPFYFYLICYSWIILSLKLLYSYLELFPTFHSIDCAFLVVTQPFIHIFCEVLEHISNCFHEVFALCISEVALFKGCQNTVLWSVAVLLYWLFVFVVILWCNLHFLRLYSHVVGDVIVERVGRLLVSYYIKFLLDISQSWRSAVGRCLICRWEFMLGEVL